MLIALAFGFSRSLGLIVLFGVLLRLMFILLNIITWFYMSGRYPTRVRAFDTDAALVVALIGASVVPLATGAIFDTAGGPERARRSALRNRCDSLRGHRFAREGDSWMPTSWPRMHRWLVDRRTRSIDAVG
ncbi:MAG TPA: hypothetical protein VKY90_21900 [Candidatus Dormibacteraeota bacterium]|nr:hypothetical protein [Candidatus Dormibacteraeota bacterium]